MELKATQKKLYVDDKIGDPRQTNMSFEVASNRDQLSKNCCAEQFSKILISTRFSFAHP